MKILRKSKGPKTTLTVVDGLRMHARVSEDWAAGRPPVVLVHGLVVSGRYMVPLLDGLARPPRASEAGAAASPPVVLVHGLVVSGRYMVPLLEELARSHAVYAPDLPGFGRSEGPAGALGAGA